jgi:HlyD family secretion protein
MIPMPCLTRAVRLVRIGGLIFAAVLLAAMPLATIGCGYKAQANASDEKSELVEVVAVNPKRMDLTREIDQPGYLQPYEQTPIYTKIAGFAKEPRYDIGDWVKKDELLVELYVPEVVQDLRVKAARVEQAKADLKQSKEAAKSAKAAEEAARADIDAKLAAVRSADADVHRWEAEVERGKKLLFQKIYDQQTYDEQINQLRSSEAKRDETRAKWISSKAVLDQAAAFYHKTEADVEVAKANVDVAQASHDQWRDWLAYSRITAPYDGIVTHRHVHTGHFLQPVNSGSTSKAAAPLFTVMRTDIMRCTVEVPEFDAVLVKEGDTAIVQLQAMPGVDITGKVTRFSYSLDDHARTLRVEVHLKNPDGKLRPGMYANVKILAKLPNATMLPTDAVMSDILADGDKNYCFMVDGGKVRKTFLQVGTRCDEGVQVLRKQKQGGKWEPFTGKELIVVDPPKQEEGAASRMVGPKALLDSQAVDLKTPEKP